MNDRNQLISSETSIFLEEIKRRNKIFVSAVLTNSIPPIKGDITKGKLKWRGIHLVDCPSRNIMYVAQRDRRISDEVTVFDFNLGVKEIIENDPTCGTSVTPDDIMDWAKKILSHEGKDADKLFKVDDE